MCATCVGASRLHNVACQRGRARHIFCDSGSKKQEFDVYPIDSETSYGCGRGRYPVHIHQTLFVRTVMRFS